MGIDRDFEAEKLRYDKRAKEILESELSGLIENKNWGSQNFLFNDAESAINSCFGANDNLLELGAGTGDHTLKLLKSTSKPVRVLDISEYSLKVLATRYPSKTIPIIASMDKIPLADNSLEGIASFGSLAYADPNNTDREIIRVLCKGGSVVIVDTMNNWSLYKIKRFLNYLLGRRTNAVVSRIPNIQRIERLAKHFEYYELKFYGFLYPFEFPLKVLFR